MELFEAAALPVLPAPVPDGPMAGARCGRRCMREVLESAAARFEAAVARHPGKHGFHALFWTEGTRPLGLGLGGHERLVANVVAEAPRAFDGSEGTLVYIPPGPVGLDSLSTSRRLYPGMPTAPTSLRDALRRLVDDVCARAAGLRSVEVSSSLRSLWYDEVYESRATAATADFWANDATRREFVAKTWAPERVLGWCLPHDERAEIL